MVQPNTRIYPVPYITEAVYSNYERHLHDLAKRLKTDIRFDFVHQCFFVKGRSQQACDETSKKLEQLLLPQLNRTVDGNLLHGTFESLESITETPDNSPSSVRSATMFSPASGKPLNLEEVHKKHSQSDVPSNDDGSEREAYYRCETESDEPEESDEEFVETFTFAKNVVNPKEILTGPPRNNAKPADYLRIIGNDTETECSLEGRSVKIVGTCEETIKEAADRFKNLQTMFKRSKRPTIVVPCAHYPVESPPFGLYFCSLDRYAYQSFVTTSLTTPAYVMLPVFKDKSGNYQKPKDLLNAPVNRPPPPPQWIMQQQQQQQQQQNQQLSLDERMKMATLEHKRNYGNTSASMAPDTTPLWGENKGFVVRTSASKPAPPSRSATPPVVPKQPVDDFPSLPSAPRPTVKKQTTTSRRVVRVVPQKASPAVASPTKSNLEIVREYNFFNIKNALTEGLTNIRGFKGGIKLSAKLGKVLWTKLSPENQKKIWNFHEIKDVLMNGHGVEPNFNDMTTRNDEIITKISEILPEPYGYSANYEIYANARNQPMVPYQPVVMHMSQGVVELKKVVTKTTKIVEVDWVSLDRKFDFQMLLKTEETTRMDVKPFNTFIKKVAVDPITRIITYENVPDFLEVDSILLKQTTKYRIHFPFVVEITRVEKLPLVQQKFNGFGIEKFQGSAGKGQVWYDLDIYYSTLDEKFKSNDDLPIGKLASWTVDDIFQTEGQTSDALVEYIRCLLLLVERCDASV
ncbi:unnamed protein product [Mucor hiemalis]